MKFIVASTAGCSIGPGERLRLADAQIATRRHALTVVDEKKGEVEPTAPIVFKRGEVIDLPAKFEELTSYLRSVLEPYAKPKSDDKAKAEAEAKAKSEAEAAAARLAAEKAGNGAPNPAA